MKTLEEMSKQALDMWGRESQLDMVIEECAELINAIQKWRRGSIDSGLVLEEGVGAELCLAQLKLIVNNPVLWEQVRNYKLDRLQRLLEEEKPE